MNSNEVHRSGERFTLTGHVVVLEEVQDVRTGHGLPAWVRGAEERNSIEKYFYIPCGALQTDSEVKPAGGRVPTGRASWKNSNAAPSRSYSPKSDARF